MPPVPAMLWDFPLFPWQGSEQASGVDRNYIVLTVFATALTLGICFFILFFVAKYHHRRRVDRSNPVTRTLPYEIAWISSLLVIGLVLFGWSAQGYYTIQHPVSDANRIYVVGKQWMWKIQHPQGQREINELHVPVGEPVQLIMSSQDVIHSFYIPAFRVKQDVLPDRYTRLWFTPTRVGTYNLFCAEYCGTDHSRMVGQVVVMTPGAYEQWLSAGAPPGAEEVPGAPGQPEAPLALRGETVFRAFGCVACHTRQGSVQAPQLSGLFGRETRLRNGELVIVDEQYIRESILEPNAKIVAGYDAPSLMPTYEGQVDEQTLRELVEFIRALRDGWPSEPGLQEQPRDDDAAADR